MESEVTKKQRLLIIRLSAMGDVAMSVPVVHAFAKAYPEHSLYFLTKPFHKSIIETIPGVRPILADVKGEHKGILGLWRLSRQLKAQGITAVADLHEVTRSKILTFFLQLPTARIDKGRAAKKKLIRDKTVATTKLETTISRYIKVFNRLGFEGIKPMELSRPAPSEAVQQLGATATQKWIGIAPFAAHPGKQYPLELMQKLITTLDQTARFSIFLLGAPSEQTVLATMAKGCEHTQVVAGTLAFSDQINLIGQLDLMLSMDSGNGHLAAMYAVPTITLWGVTHPALGFAPFGQEAHVLVSDREAYPLIPTSVYGNKLPQGYKGLMQSIAVKTILDKIDELV